jgi:hypothetical protein
MKINPVDLKVGSRLKSFDMEDKQWYISEVKSINNNVLTLVDVDEDSIWQGMEWEVSTGELQDEKLHKSL